MGKVGSFISNERQLRKRGKSDMEDSIFINAGDANTLADGSRGVVAEGVEAAQIPREKSFWSKVKKGFLVGLRAYGAALVRCFVVVPILTSAVTIGLYFSLPLLNFNQTTPSWYPVVNGAFYTYIAWWIIAVLGSFFTKAEVVNASSYGLLTSRLSQLEARLHEITVLELDGKSRKLSEYQLVALREAYGSAEDLKNYLYKYPYGLPWVLGLGYINAWGKIHHAEEALIEVEPVEMVIHDAMHDKLAIQDSQLSSRDELLMKLRKAVKELNPAMEGHFKTYQPWEDNEEIHKLRQDIKKIAIKIEIDLEGNLSKSSEADQVISLEAEARARVTVGEVRRTLNEFRDRLWEGLVRARNHLLATIFVTGLVTHILLCIAILSSTPSPVDPTPNRELIIAATVFYIVGAVAGLFGRIYRESQTSTAVDDYGLSLARLIATPLLSGLAGVGGVLIYSTLLFESTSPSSNIVQNIFTLNRPDFLIAAALFGFAPNLLIRGLQQRSDKYISALQSSKGAEREAATDGN